MKIVITDYILTVMEVMKKTGSILILVLCLQICHGQQVDLKDFYNLLDMTPSKLETHLQKKGYRLAGNSEDGTAVSFRMDSKKEKCTRCFDIPRAIECFDFTYQTTSAEEYRQLEEEIRAAGFGFPENRKDTSAILYQRLNTRIECSQHLVDSTVYYTVRVGRKPLPRKKDISSAEDLLVLDAQQYLIDVFGQENLKTDLFYFTETETNRCTVLFPGTDREVIFVWNDEENLKDIAFIVIGGSVRPKAAVSHTAVGQNVWTSKQGIHCGMTMQELQELNKGPIHFYNWKTESAGYLAPENKGVLNFRQLGIVFNCLNCNYIKISDARITDSQSAIGEDQKIYVVSYILLPEKKAAAVASSR